MDGEGNVVEAASAPATATASPATVPVEKEIKWANGTAVQANNVLNRYGPEKANKIRRIFDNILTGTSAADVVSHYFIANS